MERFLSQGSRQVKCTWWGDSHSGHFYQPYFKDKDLFPPPRNKDTIVKLRREEVNVAVIHGQIKCKFKLYFVLIILLHGKEAKVIGYITFLIVNSIW